MLIFYNKLCKSLDFNRVAGKNNMLTEHYNFVIIVLNLNLSLLLLLLLLIIIIQILIIITNHLHAQYGKYTEQNYKHNTFVFAPICSSAELKDLILVLCTKTSQVTYVTMVPRVGNETLHPLGVATGNALSVTRSEDTYEKTPPVGRRQPMTSLPACHNISAAGRKHHQLLRLKLASEAWPEA